MGARHLSPAAAAGPISVDVVFERFPASVRGAVVIRGADPDPHQVALVEASVVELRAPSRAVRPLPADRVTVDLAPRSEVMIPFDVPFIGLPPGWYRVLAEVLVDGRRRVRTPGDLDARRFVVGWPSELVRRGTVDVDSTIAVPGSDGARIARLECRADRAVVRWEHAPSADPTTREFGELRVLADGKPLPLLESSFQPATGQRVTVVYPVPRKTRSIRLELDRRFGPGGSVARGAWSIEVRLE